MPTSNLRINWLCVPLDRHKGDCGWLAQGVGEPILEPIQLVSFWHAIQTLQRQCSDVFWSRCQSRLRIGTPFCRVP